jgi:DNA-directed RNA polymerase specialized sigma24 family protein
MMEHPKPVSVSVVEGAPTERTVQPEPTDGELLERFRQCQDGHAFEALLWRHGPMVLAACRRVLGRTHDAEDAFRGTFMMLAHRAGSIARPELLGNWLYGVAYRTARKARSTAARRRHRLARGRDLLRDRLVKVLA